MGTAGIVAVPIPPNGPPGDVLTKVTAADYDMDWMPGGGGGGAVWGGITGNINNQTDLIALISRSVGAGMGAAMSFMDDGASEDFYPVISASGTGTVGPTGPPGAPGPAVFMSLDDVDVEPSPVIPGTAGAQGSPGAPGSSLSIFLQADDVDTEPAPMVPGTPGTNGSPGSAGLQIFLQADDVDTEPAPIVPGSAGAAGTPGSSGLQIFLQADDVDTEPAPMIPGSPGASGSAGANGQPGPAVYLEAEPGEDGQTIVGPQGIQGPSGGGGGTLTQATAVFPFPAKYSGVANVVDAAMGATDKVVISIAGSPETQENANDALDPLIMRAVPQAGSFDLQMSCLTPFAGSVVVNYSRAA